MNTLDKGLLEDLFDITEQFIAEDKENLEIPLEFDEELPPYSILLELLLDWANSPEANDESRHSAFEILLHHALQHLRYEFRQQDDGAKEWWAILQDTLQSALKENHVLLCHNLIRGLADLDFVLPEELIPAAAEWHFENFQHFNKGTKANDNLVEFPQHPDAVLNSMLEQLQPESGSEIYEVLKPELHYLPREGVSLIAQQLLSSKNPMACNAALLMLLHPRLAVRETLIDTLSIQTFLSDIDATGRNRLILLRNYLSKDQSDQLDKAIKTLNRRNLSTHQSSKSAIQIWASVMDGAGATALAALRSVGSRCQVSGIILKEGIGIVDCWETPLLKKSEAKQTLSTFRENLPQTLLVNGDYLQQLLPHYLYLNKTSGELPQPILLEWLERLGEGQWQPNCFQFQQWLEELAPELKAEDEHAAFLRCARWYDRERESLHWWEESNEIDEFVERLLDTDNTSLNEVELLEQVFAPFRQNWMERFIQLSLWAQCSVGKTKPQWQDFALLALAIARDTAIADLPILPAVIEDSLQAAAQHRLADSEAHDHVEDIIENLVDEEVDEEVDDHWGFESGKEDNQPYTPDLFAPQYQQAVSQKIGRNQPCICGSGKKYKQCCGK